jgi:hypothetical protein
MYLTLHRIAPRRRKSRNARRVLYACLLLGAIPLAASAGLVAASKPPKPDRAQGSIRDAARAIHG